MKESEGAAGHQFVGGTKLVVAAGISDLASSRSCCTRGCGIDRPPQGAGGRFQ